MIYQDYMNANFAEFTDENLASLKEDLIKEEDEIIRQYTNDVKEIDNDDFDPYSFWGERKLKKIAKKYVKHSAAISVLLEDIEREMELRENYRYEQQFSGSGKFVNNQDQSKEEFLQTEQEKTRKHRIYLDIDEK